MIDWTAILQWLGGAAFLTLVGIGLRAVFTERGTVMASLLDDVKSLRADANENDEKLVKMNDRLQAAQTALIECMTGRGELARELKSQQLRIADLEAQVRKYTGQGAS